MPSDLTREAPERIWVRSAEWANRIKEDGPFEGMGTDNPHHIGTEYIPRSLHDGFAAEWSELAAEWHTEREALLARLDALTRERDAAEARGRAAGIRAMLDALTFEPFDCPGERYVSYVEDHDVMQEDAVRALLPPPETESGHG